MYRLVDIGRYPSSSCLDEVNSICDINNTGRHLQDITSCYTRHSYTITMSYQQYGSSYGSQQYGYYPDQQQSYYTEERIPSSSTSSRTQLYYTSSSDPRTIRPTTTGYPTPPASPYTTSNPYASSPQSSYSTSPTSPICNYFQPYSQASKPRPQPIAYIFPVLPPSFTPYANMTQTRIPLPPLQPQLNPQSLSRTPLQRGPLSRLFIAGGLPMAGLSPRGSVWVCEEG